MREVVSCNLLRAKTGQTQRFYFLDALFNAEIRKVLRWLATPRGRKLQERSTVFTELLFPTLGGGANLSLCFFGHTTKLLGVTLRKARRVGAGELLDDTNHLVAVAIFVVVPDVHHRVIVVCNRR